MNHKHVRIRKNAIANVSQDCPQKTIDALGKMVDLVNKKLIIKSVSFLAINLKFLRKRNSLSQQDLADRINCKRSSIGAYEEDRADPKIKTLITISEYFGVTIDDLVNKEITSIFPKK